MADILEKLARLSQSNDYIGFVNSITCVADPIIMSFIVKILLRLDMPWVILKSVIRHAVRIDAVEAICEIIKAREIFTLSDVLEYITTINQAHLIFALNNLGIVTLSINDIICASDVYKKYRSERFSLLRQTGMSPNVAHQVNEWMF